MHLNDKSDIIEEEYVSNINNLHNNGINYIIKSTNEWMNHILNNGLLEYNKLYPYIYPFGSITFHKLFPCSRKKLLICFPNSITSNDISDSFIPWLKLTGKVVMMVELKNEETHQIQFEIENNSFEIVFCLLPLQYCTTRKPQFSLISPPPNLTAQLPLQSLQAFNCARNCAYVHHVVSPHNRRLFCETLFYLKKWALFKLVCSDSRLCYLNESALTLMLAAIFQQQQQWQQQSPNKLHNSRPGPNTLSNLYIFFRHYLEFNWAHSDVRIDCTFNSDGSKDHSNSDHENHNINKPNYGSRDAMTVLTPTPPHRNTLAKVHPLTRDRIIDQLRDALFYLEKTSVQCALSNSHLLRPTSLVDFLHSFSLSTSSNKILLLSCLEQSQQLHQDRFLHFFHNVLHRLSSSSPHLLSFPLIFHNIGCSSRLRIFHILLLLSPSFKGGGSSFCSQSNPLQLQRHEIPFGMTYRVEIVHDDLRILSLNLDHAHFISGVIRTEIR